MSSPSELTTNVDAAINASLNRIGAGQLVTLADIIEFLQLLPKSTRYRLLTKSQGQIIPTLCLRFDRPPSSRLSGRRSTIDSAADAQKRTSLLTKRCKRYEDQLSNIFGVAWLNPAILLIINDNGEIEAIRQKMQAHVNLMIVHTQLWANIQKDVAYWQFAMREKELSHVNNVEKVAKAISQATNCDCVVLEQCWRPKTGNFNSTKPNPPIRLGFRQSTDLEIDKDAWRLEAENSTARDSFLAQACRESLDRAKIIDLTRIDWSISPVFADCMSCFVIPFAHAADVCSHRAQVSIVYRKAQHRLGRITVSELTAAQQIIHAFLEEQSFEGKAKAFNEAAEAVTGVKFEHLTTHDDDRELNFRAYVDRMCRSLVRVTQAHSVTVRLHNPINDTLRLVGSCDVTSSEKRTEINEEIKIGKGTGSSVAFAFRKARDFPAVDLPNRPVIPQTYRSKGLRLLSTRTDTQSSISIPISLGSLTLGVLHLESPYLRAFVQDKNFLLAMARSIALYFDRLQGAFDAEFRADKIAYFGRIHDLKDLVEQLGRTHGSIAEKINSIVGQMLYAPRDNDSRIVSCNLHELLGIICKYKYAQGADLQKYAKERIKILDNGFDIYGTSRVERAISFIFENFYSNLINHADVDSVANNTENAMARMRIYIDGRPNADGEIEGGMLNIDYFISPALHEALEQRIGCRPIEDPARGERIGLYTVGLVVRTLGGVMAASRSMDELQTIISIRMPVSLCFRARNLKGSSR